MLWAVVARVPDAAALAAIERLLVSAPGATRLVEHAPEFQLATIVEGSDGESLRAEVRALVADAVVDVRRAAPSSTAAAVIDNLKRLGGTLAHNDEDDAALLRMMFGDSAAIVESVVTVRRRAGVFARESLLVTAGLSADPARAELSLHDSDLKGVGGASPMVLAQIQSALDDELASGHAIGASLATDLGSFTIAIDEELARVSVRAWRCTFAPNASGLAKN